MSSLTYFVSLHRKLILMQDLKETTCHRAVLRERIMDTAMMAFSERGVKAVKMDDIAAMLGISKRTLYEIFEDKETLLFQGVVKLDRQRQEHLFDYAEQGHHVIDIIMEACRIKVAEMRSVNAVFYEDIMKYPQVEAYVRNEHERALADFLKFMQRGVDEGYLRPDINYDLIPHILDAFALYVKSNKLIRKYSIEDIFRNMLLVALRGICTAKGVEAVDEAVAKIL